MFMRSKPGRALLGQLTGKGTAKRCWFSLIELLVVISIIALLVGLLAPVLSKAKGVGKRAACANNLKQLALANELYANNFSCYAPGRSGGYYTGQHWCGSRDSSNDPWDASKSLLAEDIGKGGQVKHCPVDKFGDKSSGKNMAAGGYGYNYAGVGSRCYLVGYQTGSGTVDEMCWGSGMKPSFIRVPTTTVMFADAAHFYNSEVVEIDEISAPYSLYGASATSLRTKRPTATNNYSKIHFRHDSSSANAVWCDGHVSKEFRVFSWTYNGADGEDLVRAAKAIGNFGPKDNSLFDPWRDDIPLH